MRLSGLQKADWFIGLALAVVLAPITRALGLVLKRDHSFHSTDTIVVMKLLGGGNFALAMPMLLGLRQSFPKSTMIAVTTPATAEFARVLGIFDSINVIHTRSILSMCGSAFRTLLSIFRADVIIDLEAHSKLSTCFGLFSCARNRLGFFTNDFFLREYLYTHLVFFNLRAPRPLLFERLAAILGARCATYLECEQHLKKALNVDPGHERRVAVGVGCSDLGRVRQLDLKQWLRVLTEELPAGGETHLVFLGSQGDRQLSESLGEELLKRIPTLTIENLCGQRPLGESLRILGESAYFYTIDSGLLHFARLLKVPCTSFWGPTDPATRLIQIEGYREDIRYNRLICSPCIHVSESPPCGGRNLCIASLFEQRFISDSEALANITIGPEDKSLRDRQ